MKGLFAGIGHNSDHFDTYTMVITAICGAVVLGIFFAVAFFSWKYHASRKHHRGNSCGENFQSFKLEIVWTVVTLFTFLGFFAWATWLYKKQVTPFEKADYEVFVLGKQWMWKAYHKTGIGEVNELHLPRNKMVRLVMLSKDVIHSLFLPDFRIKQDLLPETYTYLHVKAKKDGTYQIFCTEYCGSMHSKMLAKAIVVGEKEYQSFIGMEDKSLKRGERLFKEQACIGCHYEGSKDAPPNLGEKVKNRDDNFIRRSIFYPKEYVEKGYKPNMPSFKDVLSEEDVRSLIRYIRSMEVK